MIIVIRLQILDILHLCFKLILNLPFVFALVNRVLLQDLLELFVRPDCSIFNELLSVLLDLLNSLFGIGNVKYLKRVKWLFPAKYAILFHHKLFSTIQVMLLLNVVFHWLPRKVDSSFRRNLGDSIFINISGCRCFNFIDIFHKAHVFQIRVLIIRRITFSGIRIHDIELLLRLPNTRKNNWSILLSPQIVSFQTVLEVAGAPIVVGIISTSFRRNYRRMFPGVFCWIILGRIISIVPGWSKLLLIRQLRPPCRLKRTSSEIAPITYLMICD